MNIQTPVAVAADLHETLVALLGSANVTADREGLEFYGADIFSRGHAPVLVIAPGNRDELSQAVAAATKAGYAVTGRGGGMSYTSGYLPVVDNVVMVDMRRMNHILELNAADMYVTVEAGITWEALYEALKPHGLRTTMWGTLSGRRATVGGGMSQNSIFFGSGDGGTTADACLGLEVCLADGTLLKTGSAAAGAKPFFRNYGPDLTGLFLGDTGAMGIKAAVTLRLTQVAAVEKYVSFGLDGSDQTIELLCEVARQQLATETVCFDPRLQKQRLKRASLTQDLSALKNVVEHNKSLLGGLKEAAKIAVAGRRFMDDVDWSAHFMIEGRDEATANSKLEAVRAIAAKLGGREIENTIPKVMRAQPFTDLTSMVGPLGERWAPVHGLTALSDAKTVLAQLEALWDANQEIMDRLKIETGYLLAPVGRTIFCIEPVFYWQDELYPVHEKTLGPDYLAKLKKFERNPEAYAEVKRLRAEAIAIFRANHATHFQIGKAYPYAANLNNDSKRIVQAIKTLLDPGHQINPGSLGL
jgi:FAD/FMN-containing dehydrogenase